MTGRSLSRSSALARSTRRLIRYRWGVSPKARLKARLKWAGDGRPITLNGAVYGSGLGVHAPGDVGLYLDGHCGRFTAVVGVDDEAGNSGSVTFSVVADGVAVYTSPTLTGASAPLPVDVGVAGARVVDLVVGDAGDGNGLDHADWADARLTCS